MIQRLAQKKIESLLLGFPCVAIVGPRQVGKTTLAKQLLQKYPNALFLDMELQSDYLKLNDPEMFLSQFDNRLVIIDEVQRKPGLFPILRALIDRNKKPARYLLLSSAAPDLIRDSSESLAGRIAYYELTPFVFREIEAIYDLNDLWFRGGFPDPLLNNSIWYDWMNNFVNTYFERDLPNLGFPADSVTGKRLWMMLAHLHGNLINYSEIAKSLELSIHTIKRYITFLEHAYLIRTIQPYYSNIKKRLVKSPKVYIRDSGVLHFLLGFESIAELFGNHKMGASWEGFVIEQIIALIPQNRQLFFFRTHDGAELDLVVVKGGVPFAGIEIKYGSDMRPTRGNTEAIQFMKTNNNYIIVKESSDYFINDKTRICDLKTFIEKYIVSV